jgi:hypothetical protein
MKGKRICTHGAAITASSSPHSLPLAAEPCSPLNDSGAYHNQLVSSVSWTVRRRRADGSSQHLLGNRPIIVHALRPCLGPHWRRISTVKAENTHQTHRDGRAFGSRRQHKSRGFELGDGKSPTRPRSRYCLTRARVLRSRKQTGPYTTTEDPGR